MKPKPVALGLDLGQATDPSALCGVEAEDGITPRGRPGRLYTVRGLRPWPLGTSYVGIVGDVRKTLESAPELTGAPLVVDASGCGRPVIDMIRSEGLPCKLMPVVITPGLSETKEPNDYWHVAKAVLISGLQVVLGQGRLRLPGNLPDGPALIRELENYRVKISPAANETWSAREGEHDDRLLALALAVWWFERSRPRAGTR